MTRQTAAGLLAMVNRFVANTVLCEYTLRAVPDRRVGLSLGGAGPMPPPCRDRRCIVEQGGVTRVQLIAYCSDDGSISTGHPAKRHSV